MNTGANTGATDAYSIGGLKPPGLETQQQKIGPMILPSALTRAFDSAGAFAKAASLTNFRLIPPAGKPLADKKVLGRG